MIRINMAQSEIERELIDQVNEIKKNESPIGVTDNLLEFGLDSLEMMRLLAEWMKKGYKVQFADLIKKPYICEWGKLFYNSEKRENIETNINISDKEPFDLSDVQYAYWIGRGEEQYLGGVGCHGYMEIYTSNIDIKKLDEAWKVVLESHPMLRSKFLEDGKQVVMDTPYNDNVIVYDLTSLSAEQREKELQEMRNKLSHRLLKIEEGEVAELQISLIDEKKSRLHFDIDLLVCDVQSFQIILRDLAKYYRYGEKPHVDPNWNFAEYLKKQEIMYKKEFIEDKKFWQEKMSKLPNGPDLPIFSNSDNVKKPKFKRRLKQFTIEEVSKLKKEGTENQITIAMLLLTAYTRTISRWSKNKKFLLNIPLFNRDESLNIENVVADFTNLVLLEADITEDRTFLKDAQNLQKTFHENVSHIRYSGIKILREMQKNRDDKIMAPVVFSCNLGIPLLSDDFIESFGDISYMISQTPQVWIDLQVFNNDKGILVLWDSIDEIFPTGLLDEMFKYFIDEINCIIENGVSCEKKILAGSQKRRLEEIENFKESTDLDNLIGTLHENILEMSKKHPDKAAIINADTGVSISYKDLVDKSKYIAGGLKSIGCRKGDKVVIFTSRGEKQAISALGVLLAGGVYIPINETQPKRRLMSIINNENIKYVITENEEFFEDFNVDILNFKQSIEEKKEYVETNVSPEDSAYIIYTSGTTGTPKGVEILHGSAINTINDINDKCKIIESDVVISVSAFDFDLSVYDLFGTLNKGATLICFEQENWRNAKAWYEIIKKYGVTVWNSVPTLLKMLLVEIESEGSICPNLRWVFLSGDWIDLDIPERLIKIAPNTEIMAMGGATEASIWSNYIRIDKAVPEEWSCIPYGRPLKNQIYRVVDEKGVDCPDYVPGELWIGGKGVAKGYSGDKKLTEEKFVYDLGMRWYKTGDMGRFWSDDTIEFMGRKDGQVKLRGHRVELGEIESALSKIDGIGKSVVIFNKEEKAPFITAYMSIDENASDNCLDRILRKDDTQFGNLGSDFIKYSKDSQYKVDEKLEEDLKRYTKAVIKNILKELGNNQIYYQNNMLISHWKEIIKDYEESPEDLTNASIQFIKNFTKPFIENIKEILSGKVSVADIVLMDDFVSAADISSVMNSGKLINSLLKRILNDLGQRSQIRSKLKVMEVGISNLEASNEYKNIVHGEKYCLADESKYYLDKASEAADEYRIVCKKLNLDGEESPNKETFDIIILNNYLHRCKNIDNALEHLSRLLNENGILVVAEVTKESAIQDITTIFLKKDYSDFRNNTLKMILNSEEWTNVFERSSFDLVSNVINEDCKYGANIFILQNKNKNRRFDEKQLKENLGNMIPQYMIPKYFVSVNSFPLTPNGKIDRKELSKIDYHVDEELNSINRKATEIEEKLMDIWKEILNTDVKINSSYFELGGDSLLATILRNKIKEQFNIEFSLEMIFKKPILEEMAEYIEEQPREYIETKQLPELVVDDKSSYEPFPLTDVQQSYLIGQSGAIDFGDVSSHCYFEMKCSVLDVLKVECILNDLINVHPMMRAVAMNDGLNQKILEKVKYYKIKNYDLSGYKIDKKKQEMEAIRDEMGNQKFDPYNWPAFDFRIVKLSEDTCKLLISMSNLFFDGWSIFYLFRQLRYYYDHPNEKPVKETVTFRDYVNTYEKLKQSSLYERDMKYWKDKLERIYSAPDLNVSLADKNMSNKFERISCFINAEEWSALKKSAKMYGMTASSLLMGVYAEVLSRWSKSPKFTINLTRFNRLPFHKDINSVVGDFTTLTLLSIDMTKGDTFADRCKNIQNTLWSDLEHSHVSGVLVERMINNRKKSQITMPIVFTSGIGLEDGMESEKNRYLGKIDRGLSQTPQVWMDVQVYEDEGELNISMDTVKEVFPDNMVEEIFSAFTETLKELSINTKLWTKKCTNIVNIPNKDSINEINNNNFDFEECTLLELFNKSIKEYGTNTAITFKERNISYLELDRLSNTVANDLIKSGIKKNDRVAILIEKGWKQIAAVLGILKAGGVYLPLNIKHPYSRNELILENSDTKFILVEDVHLETYSEKYVLIEVKDIIEDLQNSISVGLNDIAYIIYTSGTTGIPKGVAIENRGAVNTILDINKRINANENDKTIALSQLNFDLSVYDIFGMLAVGGTIVIPDPEKVIEPQYWIELLSQERITTWNTVPSFMQMLLGYIENNKYNSDYHLRNILLSGDWIPVNIKERIDKLIGKCNVYGLGGATEASIWSNIYTIEEEDMNKNSIPYGKPLANQHMYILNEMLDHCPNNVIGEIYIGGRGLANCYWNDSEKTKNSFIIHPVTKERIYKTGDLGMYGKDKNIIFLGREDGQVKLNGYRIEINEIETCIKSIEEVEDCVVIVDNQILAFVVIKSQIAPKEISDYLIRKLPDYMIPKFIKIIDSIPLTGNGKVDRKTLINIREISISTNETVEITEFENKLINIWKTILNVGSINISDDFFAIGGNSLKAVHVINEIKKEYNIELKIQDLFKHSNILQLSKFIKPMIQDDIEEGEI